MKLIVGLGNPGEQYKNTRHNLGFMALDYLADNLDIKNWQLKFNALIIETKIKNKKIILAKPQTFMNNSGMAVKNIINYFKIAIKDILIIHDEIDLELGKFKFQTGRGAAGHKGVQSIIDILKTNNFTRLRIGIGKEEFVLQKFTEQEQKIALKTIKKALIRPLENISLNLGGINSDIDNSQAD